MNGQRRRAASHCLIATTRSSDRSFCTTRRRPSCRERSSSSIGAAEEAPLRHRQLAAPHRVRFRAARPFLHCMDRNLGYGRAHNSHCVRRTDAQYSLVMNTDMVYAPGAVLSLYAFLQSILRPGSPRRACCIPMDRSSTSAACCRRRRTSSCVASCRSRWAQCRRTLRTTFLGPRLAGESSRTSRAPS